MKHQQLVVGALVLTSLVTAGVCRLVWKSDEAGSGAATTAVLQNAIDQAGGFEAVAARANESAAISTLRNLASSQKQFQASRAIDRNQNEVGEFGFFSEMSGALPITGMPGKARKVAIPVLSPAFHRVKLGRVERSGYVFELRLPGKSAPFVVEGQPTDAARAEKHWRCYAWPLEYGKTGGRAFFVDETGEVLASDNTATRYSGATKTPAPFAALPAPSAEQDSNGSSKNAAADGQAWQPAGHN